VGKEKKKKPRKFCEFLDIQRWKRGVRKRRNLEGGGGEPKQIINPGVGPQATESVVGEKKI